MRGKGCGESCVVLFDIVRFCSMVQSTIAQGLHVPNEINKIAAGLGIAVHL